MASLAQVGCDRDEGEPEPDAIVVDEISIEFPRDIGSMPTVWRSEYEPLSVDPLPKEQTKAAAGILADAIQSYPDDFLGEHLTNVYVYADMIFYGDQSTAGITAGASGMHLSYNDADPFWLEQMFHCLVAEHLFYKFPDLVDEVGFDYPITATKLDLADSPDRKEKLLKKGYLYPQSTRSVGDDFSYIAADLLAGSRSALQDAKDYKIIGEKMAKVKKFFSLLDERFTEDFFRQQSEGKKGHRGY